MSLHLSKCFFSLVLSFVAINIQFNCAAQEFESVQRLTPTQIKADLEIIEEAYNRIHPGYSRYESEENLQQAWSDIRQLAEKEKGLSIEQFYLEIQKNLVMIRCDHTKAELPKILATQRNSDPVYLPLRWTFIEGRGLITEDLPLKGIQSGDEILSIDGRSLEELKAKFLPYGPVDGFTEWGRAGELSASYELMGGVIDNFSALLWNIPPVAKLEIKSASGSLRVLELDRVVHKEWKSLQGDSTDFDGAVSFERIGESAAYLKVDSFINYRNYVDPKSVFEPIFKALKKEKRSKLILDLRQNGGGSNDARLELFANLITQKVQPKLDMQVKTLNLDGLRDYLWTWEKRALKPNPLGFKKNKDGTYSMRSFLDDDLKKVKPRRYAFDGELIILTSNSNSSGSTNLIATLKSHADVTLIGEKTGGSAEGPTAGVLFYLTLPESKIKTRLPLFMQYNNVKNFERGLGVNPDIEAKTTVESFRAGKDVAYEKALEYLEID